MKYKKLLIVLTAVTALGIAGCGKSSKETAEVTPTPVPTAAPTAAPATSTPLPTSTPAPKLIGVKTSTAKFVYLTNSTKERSVRSISARQEGKNGAKVLFLQKLPSKMRSRCRCITPRILQEMPSMI